jgi:hypothetical protein
MPQTEFALCSNSIQWDHAFRMNDSIKRFVEFCHFPVAKSSGCSFLLEKLGHVPSSFGWISGFKKKKNKQKQA